MAATFAAARRIGDDACDPGASAVAIWGGACGVRSWPPNSSRVWGRAMAPQMKPWENT
jgi:hypothetical protein